jgi:hypothetical protein
MRVHILALAAFSIAGVAHAGSIETIKMGIDRNNSVVTINCDRCEKMAEKKATPSVIELKPGTQRIEYRDVAGVMKVYRTEAWLGGSPVVFVSKASPEEVATLAKAVVTPDPAAAETVNGKPEEKPAVTEANMIDLSATTSAVNADMGAQAKVMPKKPAFDAGGLELRLD